MALASGSVAFLVVARIEDKAILAERLDKGTSETEKKAIKATLLALLERASYLKYAGWKEQRQCSGAFDGSVYALADEHGDSIVGVGLRGGLYPYPPRVAWDLLKQFADAVRQQELDLGEAKPGALSLPLKKDMHNIMRNYSEPGDQDSVTQVQQKVDGVKALMHDNVRKILETHTTIDNLQDKSADMNKAAVMFVQQSSSLKRQMQIRNLKVKAAMVISVAALGAYALLPFFGS